MSQHSCYSFCTKLPLLWIGLLICGSAFLSQVASGADGTTPAKSEAPIAKASAKTIDGTYLDAPVRVKDVAVAVPLSWKWGYVRPLKESHETQLRDVPQVDLDPEYAKKSRTQLAEAASDIAAQNGNAPDAFIKKLVTKRTELAGLPFAMGDDCKLTADDAKSLAVGSLGIRTGLARMGNKRASVLYHGESDAEALEAADFLVVRSYLESGVPAMHQILTAEKADFRRLMARQLKNSRDPRATQSLIKLALFDLDAEVREAALLSLSKRPAEAYRAEIVKAMRYPWAPVNRNAAQAVVNLDMKDAIPELVAMFSQPEPTAPFPVATADGKQKMMVREMVRINHHRNCMLCHAPLGDLKVRDDLPVGPVTSMQEPLPSVSSVEYYSSRPPDGILVRADVTYLRQDFSLLQEVQNRGTWPALQRFDFMVRTREATDADRKERTAAPEISPHTQALLAALEGLTGKSRPPQAAAWAQEVRDAPSRKMPASSK